MANRKGFPKFLEVLFNIVWVIFIGFIGAIICILNGILSCACIIPIFFGIPLCWFKAVPLVFAPGGKEVVTHFDRAPIRNAFNIVFGGLWTFLAYYIFGIILCITIIFIPIGKQCFKLGKYLFLPFGAEVTK